MLVEKIMRVITHLNIGATIALIAWVVSTVGFIQSPRPGHSEHLESGNSFGQTSIVAPRQEGRP